MKKAIAIVLVVVMALAMVACGSSSSSSTSTTSTTSTSTNTSTSTTSTTSTDTTATTSEPTVISFDMHHIWTAGSMYEQVFVDYFAYLEEYLGGKYKFDVNYYANGVLLSVPDVYQGTVDGVVQMGATTPDNLTDIMPALNFPSLPRICYRTTGSEMSRILMNYIYEFKLDEIEFKDTKFMAAFGAPCMYIYSNSPIHTPDDVKGLDTRCGGTWAKTIGDCGANPVSMPMSEIVSSAQKGLIKAAVSHMIDYNQDLNLKEVFTCATNIGWLGASELIVFMNKDFFESLPADVQAAIDDTHYYLAYLGSAVWDYMVEQAIESARADGATVIDQLTTEEMEAWRAATANTADAYIEEYGPNVERVDGVSVNDLYDYLQAASEKYVGGDYTKYVPGTTFEPSDLA